MQNNLEKFQGIAIGQKSKSENMTFNLDGDCIINCDEEVKLLGVNFYFKINLIFIFLICVTRPLNI